MSDTDYAEWVEEIHRKAVRFSIVFLQIGFSNEPARRALIDSRVTVQHLDNYLENGSGSITGILVLDKIESMLLSHAEGGMGLLREKVVQDVKDGSRVILLSRAPRVSYPVVVGSSLLDDASFAHAPSFEGKRPEDWPTCVEDGASVDEVLLRTVAELGTELCASLDRVVFESSLTGSDALQLLSDRELEALDGAGITVHDRSVRSWNFPRHLAPLKHALSEVLADALDPQHQLAIVSSGLWKIERIVRREVRRRSIEAWAGNWRMQCLNGDLPDKVLERASEAAYLSATSVKHLRDPLEWLSLGELLQLRERREIGNLGLTGSSRTRV